MLTAAARREYELALDWGLCVCRESCLAADRRAARRGVVWPFAVPPRGSIPLPNEGEARSGD